MFKVCLYKNQSRDTNVVLEINVVNDGINEVPIEEWFLVESLATIMINFDGHEIEDYNYRVKSLIGIGYYFYTSMVLGIDMKNRPTPPDKPLIEKTTKFGVESFAQSSLLCIHGSKQHVS